MKVLLNCFRREDADIWKVVFGINNLDHPSVFMQTRFVKTILLHPRYNRAVVDYDISVVELSDDIHETSYVRPVCLPSPEEFLEPDTYCYITGWGHMGNKSKPGSSAMQIALSAHNGKALGFLLGFGYHFPFYLYITVIRGKCFDCVMFFLPSKPVVSIKNPS